MGRMRVGASVRARLSRELRDLPPGRRLRLRLAVDVAERCFGDRQQVRVLDAGSEEGLLCLELARRRPTWTLVAADLAMGALLQGRRWAGAEHLRIHFVRCDLQRPIAIAAYDLVVALESLAEVPDDRAALSSMAAALRPGGLLIAQVPTSDWTPVLRSAERTWRREVRHGYDAAQLTAVLEELGFAVELLHATFHRLVAFAQDLRDRAKHRRRWVQLALLPVMAAAVGIERRGYTWGRPRALFVVARRC